ncbi:MAG TPA: hypothetical protein VGF88_13555 [Acidobacteriaceae bacterium]
MWYFVALLLSGKALKTHRRKAVTNPPPAVPPPEEQDDLVDEAGSATTLSLFLLWLNRRQTEISLPAVRLACNFRFAGDTAGTRPAAQKPHSESLLPADAKYSSQRLVRIGTERLNRSKKLQFPCIFTRSVLSCSLKILPHLHEAEISTQHSANPMVSKSERHLVRSDDSGVSLLDPGVIGTVIERSGISQSIHILQSLYPGSPLTRCEPVAVDQLARIN